MVAQRLDDDEVSFADLIDSMGRKQKMTIVNEPGLYSVILCSDKPEAKVLKQWIMRDVVHGTHQHGIFVAQNVPDVFNDIDKVINEDINWDEELTDELLDKVIKQQERELELMQKLKEYMLSLSRIQRNHSSIDFA